MSKVRFFFPDNHDYVDPFFNYDTEETYEHRVIQRDDKYAHEIFSKPVYDGLLVSKAVVEGVGRIQGRFSVAQKNRFYREGVYRFYRLPKTYQTMGDCGAFSYAMEEVPPFSVDSVAQFYQDSGFSFGVSLDHIIFDYSPSDKVDRFDASQIEEFKRRQAITLENAEEFLKTSAPLSYTALGVAHGWSPESYAESVSELQKMGYERIAMGGMIPLKTKDILEVLAIVDPVRKTNTQFHLLGINRLDAIVKFADFGVSSFDSTSPLMKGLKDEKFNYHVFENGNFSAYTSIAIPQTERNNAIKKLISKGQVDNDDAVVLERECLKQVKRYREGEASSDELLKVLVEYEKLFSPNKSREDTMREVLEDMPWKDCPCDICQELGVHVLIKRAAARNRRRGFHNLFVAYKRLQYELSQSNG